MDLHWLFRGRLTPPSYRVALLPTPALRRLEADGSVYKVVLVTGPAGYGKTALLAQWRGALRAAGTRTAWISVSAEQNDPAQLLTYVAMSLIDAGVDLGPVEKLVEQWFADTPISAAVAAVAGQLARDSQPMVLLIDDIHHLSRATAEQVLGPLLLPGLPLVHVAMAGRNRPALLLADLRTRGEILEFEADALRFGTREIEVLVPDLAMPQRELLAARTQGWPVAVQLARLWLTAKPERVALIAGFSGRTAEVAEYLTEQVLSDLPSAARGTLEATAPLETMCSGLVEAVTGSVEAWTELIKLPALAHLVVPLDEAREWYRLHPLLADFLRDRLHRQDLNLERQCHARASIWFEEHGMIRDAVRHAAAAGDIDRAASLIERTGGWELIVFGGAGLLRALLMEIPSNRLAAYPRVDLFRAFLDAKEGAVVDARRRYDGARTAAERSGAIPVTTPLGRDLHVVGYLVSRYEDRPVEPGALQLIYREIEALAPEDAIGRAALLNTACLLGLALGEMHAAHDACDRAVREMRSLGSVLGLSYCALHLGLASLHLGHLREAEATFREALDLAEENFGVDSGLRAVADIHLAVALLARGNLAGAADLFARSLEHIEAYDGWTDVYAEGYAAAISLALNTGVLDQAEAYLERATATAERRRLSRLQRLVGAHRARLHVRAGRLDEARVALSWRSGEWREQPFGWREHHANGIAAAELEIVAGRPTEARLILADLAAAAATGHRVRDARVVEFLTAVAAYGGGARDDAAAALVLLLEPALREDDTEFLVESGPLAIPLLQYARQWTRDHGTSTLARQVLGAALARLAAAKPESRTTTLSARELEVLAELARASSNKLIARALQMTENTVKFHLKNIFQKLGVRHRAQAINTARERGLIR
ncbi:MAG TPA: LuxR C-terminal-related transcriptional regulator [Steroidobacteraceae bacterium]